MNLKRGFEGELYFDSLTEKLQCDRLILNDLLLTVNSTVFQIDTLIITPETIHIFEVKNYEGDYYYEADKFFKIPQFEIINPLHQLSRSESLLRQLFLKHNINLPIAASVIFINPEFTLYQAPSDKPIILPTQIKRHLNQLNIIPSRLNRKHKLIADKLISLHIKVSSYNQFPEYTYEQLKKGVTCSQCDSFSISVEGQMCVCEKCGNKEKVASTVMKAIEEYKLLFPGRKVTTRAIHEWCQTVESKKRIRTILDRNFKMNGLYRWAHFE